MKYDASMTEFHGDIVAAVRLMCGKDTDARSNSEGASPAPLRDYLKNRYGYNGKCSNGAMYQNTPSKGMEIRLDREVDNSGDMSITLSWSQVAKFIRDNPSEIFGEENKPAEPPAPAPAQTETAVVFDYSDLDTDTAAKLETITAEIFNVRKEYIFTMAKKVAYAHDLLANYGNGKFGAWCESIGITRQTGNNLIQIVKLFDNSTEIERQNLEKLTDGNVKLLYEAARPSAPAELVEAVKNGDITTHKEYIELKKQLEEANKKLEDAKFHSKQQSESFDRVSEQSDVNYHKYLDEMHKNQDLMKQIRELESRPVEVAVDVDELNRRVEKVSIELQNQTARQIAAEREDFAQKLNRMEDENDELRAELEKAKAAKTNDNVKTVLLRMTLDELAELAEVVPVVKFKTIIKKAQVLRV